MNAEAPSEDLNALLAETKSQLDSLGFRELADTFSDLETVAVTDPNEIDKAAVLKFYLALNFIRRGIDRIPGTVARRDLGLFDPAVEEGQFQARLDCENEVEKFRKRLKAIDATLKPIFINGFGTEEVERIAQEAFGANLSVGGSAN